MEAVPDAGTMALRCPSLWMDHRAALTSFTQQGASAQKETRHQGLSAAPAWGTGAR